MTNAEIDRIQEKSVFNTVNSKTPITKKEKLDRTYT